MFRCTPNQRCHRPRQRNIDLSSAGQFDGQGEHHTPAPYVEKAFRKYLECGNTRRMAGAVAHLTDPVFPCLPVRQWVLSVPKRLRYLQRDKGSPNAALRIFLRVVQQSLQGHCPGAAQCDPASLHLGAVVFRTVAHASPSHNLETPKRLT